LRSSIRRDQSRWNAAGEASDGGRLGAALLDQPLLHIWTFAAVRFGDTIKPADIATAPSMINLDAYFARIGHRGPTSPTKATLDALAQAHVQSIPFENLDVLLGKHIDLSLEAIFDKLVTRARGGYCFEQNGLFLEVLRAMGFLATPLSARVRWQRPRDFIPTRTHLFVRVELDGVSHLADVGVGGLSMTSSVLLDREGEQPTPHEPRRIVREGARLFHQAKLAGEWHDVTEFTLEEMPPIDRELANWYTSTHPNSHFKSRLMVARALPQGGRVSIVNRERSLRNRDGSSETRTLGSQQELLSVLANDFGLRLPEGSELRCPGLDWPK